MSNVYIVLNCFLEFFHGLPVGESPINAPKLTAGNAGIGRTLGLLVESHQHTSQLGDDPILPVSFCQFLSVRGSFGVSTGNCMKRRINTFCDAAKYIA